MGLDIYAYQMSRPTLPNRTYQYQELASQMMVILPQERENPRYLGLLPFTIELSVVNTYVDFERIRRALGYDSEPEIYGYSSNGYIWTSGKKDGVRVNRQVYGPDYYYDKEEQCPVCERSLVAYWRGECELQEFFYARLGDIENCGYHLIPIETIQDFNRAAQETWGQLPEVEPTKDHALFYHEWY